MLSNDKGFTLVEMMIAMVIILVVALGLVQATLLNIDSNVRDLLRDEAVRLAEERMNALKNRPVDDDNLPPTVNQCDAAPVIRTVRNFNEQYKVCTTITNLSGDNQKSLQVIVGWDYKKETPPPYDEPTFTEFQHSITSIVVRAQ